MTEGEGAARAAVPSPRWRELGGILLAGLAYEASRLLRIGDPRANARWLWALERRLGLAVEAPLQAWVVQHPVLVDALSWYYLPMHVLPFVAAAAYHLSRMDRGYWRFRRAAYGAILPGIVLYALFPVAPPRSLPGSGLANLVQDVGAPSLAGPILGRLANPVGAFPSEHVIVAVVVAWTLTRLHDARLWPIGLAHVAITSLAVVATGHHFALDVVAGWLLGAAGIWVAERRSLPGEPEGV